MAIFARRLAFLVILAALCCGGRTAHAQASPLSYWTPGWPLGLSGASAGSEDAASYGNFPGFESREVGGSSYSRYNFSNGWFVGNSRNNFGMSGIGATAAFGNYGSLYREGMQFGYNLKNSIGLPVSVFGSFNNLKYSNGFAGSPFATFDTNVSGTLPAYSAQAGVEFRPTSNLSLSFSAGYAQQPTGIDTSSIAAQATSPFTANVRR